MTPKSPVNAAACIAARPALHRWRIVLSHTDNMEDHGPPDLALPEHGVPRLAEVRLRRFSGLPDMHGCETNQLMLPRSAATMLCPPAAAAVAHLVRRPGCASSSSHHLSTLPAWRAAVECGAG